MIKCKEDLYLTFAWKSILTGKWSAQIGLNERVWYTLLQWVLSNEWPVSPHSPLSPHSPPFTPFTTFHPIHTFHPISPLSPHLTLSVLSPMWSIIYVAAKGLMGYIHVQTMLISPAIPGPLFLKIPKSNYLFCENYTIFTLIVPENFRFPRNSRKYQGVGG